MNTFANYCIFMGFLRHCTRGFQKMTKQEVKDAYIAGARYVGYRVKVKECSCLEQQQFLKHSCSIVNGHYEPWMNLAPFFRGYGSCYGEMTGKGDFKTKCVYRNSDVSLGRREWGDHVVNDAFRSHIISERFINSNVYHEEYGKSSCGATQHRIGTESLCMRYGCTVGELEQLCDVIRFAKIGDIIKHKLIERIYLIDYG